MVMNPDPDHDLTRDPPAPALNWRPTVWGRRHLFRDYGKAIDVSCNARVQGNPKKTR